MEQTAFYITSQCIPPSGYQKVNFSIPSSPVFVILPFPLPPPEFFSSNLWAAQRLRCVQKTDMDSINFKCSNGSKTKREKSTFLLNSTEPLSRRTAISTCMLNSKQLKLSEQYKLETFLFNGSASLSRTVIDNPMGVFFIQTNHADSFPFVLQEH